MQIYHCLVVYSSRHAGHTPATCLAETYLWLSQTSGSVLLILAIRIWLQWLPGCWWSLPLFLECFQYVDNKARLGGACNICPTSKPLQRASSQPLAKYSQIHWHNYQAIFLPNLNISIKHTQAGQSLRFALHKRFRIAVGCRFAWGRARWFQQSRDSWKGSGSSDVCQELLPSTHRWLMNAEFSLLTFKIWIQMPLPREVEVVMSGRWA